MSMDNVVPAVRRGLGRHQLLTALCALGVLLAPRLATAGPSPYGGWRWIGKAAVCSAPGKWRAERLFLSTGLPGAVNDICVYTWLGRVTPLLPSLADVANLAAQSGATELTEDVPVVTPMSGTWTPEEEALLSGLRATLVSYVGDVSMLPSMPTQPRVRIVAIDSAPDAVHGHITPGTNRHGDTLAHLIEDVVCRRSQGQGDLVCAAEVTTSLALPWVSPGVRGTNGGNIGTLSDLAGAIDRALARWNADRASAPSTPAHLLLNLSVGWEHVPGIAPCTTDPLVSLGLPARGVRAILQHAASAGAIIVASAGNDSGGPSPRAGLVCPGLYQAVPRLSAPGQSLVATVSAVDYADRPLETARPAGIAGFVGLGVGGVAWAPGTTPPPQLVGSSVATAVVSAVSAVLWSHRSTWSGSQVLNDVYSGGVDTGAADECALFTTTCRARRVSVCGALLAGGVNASCVVPAAEPSGWPYLPVELDALRLASAGYLHEASTPVDPLQLVDIPRYQAPSPAVEPWVFPTPISATCPTCRVSLSSTANTTVELVVTALDFDLYSPMLVVRLSTGDVAGLSLGTTMTAGVPRIFEVPSSWVTETAYLTGVTASGKSFTEQIFVEK